MNSTEVKHTPGPWSVLGDSIVGPDGKVVAAALGDLPIRPANAYLIAAAPDLLDALRPFAEEPCNHNHVPESLCPREVARLAIRKTVGGSK